MKARNQALASIIALVFGFNEGASAIPRARVDAIVERARVQWNQPGIALAIVDGDEPVYTKGYGVRDLRSGAPVTANTLFGIGSCSKSFAAATVAKLVDTRRLAWDDRLDQHLPWFRTSDPWVTHELRVRDILTHRTGLHAAIPRDAAEDRLSYLRSIAMVDAWHPLRYQYSYTNDMFTLAGQLVAETSGSSWAEFADRELWRPLGMARTNADHRKSRTDPDSATPNMIIEGGTKPAPVEWVYEDATAIPSGGVNSSAADMARWLRFQMEEGASADGLLSTAAFEEMHAPQTPLRGEFAEGDRDLADIVGRGNQGYQFPSYGMGWFVDDYRGNKLIHHGGRIWGFRCVMAVIPEKKFGIALLFNSDHLTSLPTALMQSLIDLRLGLPAKDWSSRFLTLDKERKAKAEAETRRLEASRIPDAPPTRPLEAYAGIYANQAGKLAVRHSDGGLRLQMGRVEYALRPWHYDIFRLVPQTLRTDDGIISWTRPIGDRAFVRFHLNEEGDMFEARTPFGSFERVRP